MASSARPRMLRTRSPSQTGRAAAGGAQAAAHAPPDDTEAQARTAQSGKMTAARPGTFDKAAFVAAVEQAITAEARYRLTLFTVALVGSGLGLSAKA
ncbi:MAG: hypothetical protein E6J41_31760 [Chloroflexi bacterium]|nr:MAG: hypothetical protein E6J41_31760 [Chloroflexota bacterium]